MRIHAIGIGGAGCRIADTLYRLRESYPVSDSIAAFDTDRETLQSVESLPEEHSYLFGDDRSVGGLGGALDLGREIGTEYADELDRALDRWVETDVEAFVFIVGFGGATGGGTVPTLIDRVRETFDVPVYVIGTLPTDDERTRTVRNAVETLDRLRERGVPVIGFDNELWLTPGERLTDARDRLDEAIATRIAVLFGAGDRTDAGPIAQQVIDASDIDRVLGDDGAVATIGYATVDVEPPGPSSRFGLGLFEPKEEPTVDTSEAVSAIETAIRKAARGKQTLEPIDGRADRTLLVVGGPPEWLNRKAIADGRRWIAEETGSGAVLHGDDPTPEMYTIFSVVLRAGIESERLRWLRDRS